MSNEIDGQLMREVLLEVTREYNERGPGFFQSRPVLAESARRLGARGEEAEQALLTMFGDLFLQGVLAWGHDIANPDIPFMHLTERGRETLRHYSRDPSNPAGYTEDLKRYGTLHPIAAAYISEALRTYAAACWRATAVLVGCAAETIVLELRDALVDRLATHGRSGPKDIGNTSVVRVLGAIQRELASHAAQMPSDLREGFESHWGSFTQEIRATRNEAGHPRSVEPVTPASVQASLLIFPPLVGLAARLRAWIERAMP